MNEYKINYIENNKKKESVITTYKFALSPSEFKKHVEKKLIKGREIEVCNIIKTDIINNIESYCNEVNALYDELFYVDEIYENENINMEELLIEFSGKVNKIAYNGELKTEFIKKRGNEFVLNIYYPKEDLDISSNELYQLEIAKQIAFLYIATNTVGNQDLHDEKIGIIDINSVNSKDINDFTNNREINDRLIDFGLILMYPSFLVNKFLIKYNIESTNEIESIFQYLKINKEIIFRRIYIYNTEEVIKQESYNNTNK